METLPSLKSILDQILPPGYTPPETEEDMQEILAKVVEDQREIEQRVKQLEFVVRALEDMHKIGH